MAYDQGLAELLRDALAGEPVSEKKMFGGLCFLLHGNMICGVHKRGAMFRVGKPHDATALALPGVQPMMFTGKVMAGFVETSDEATADDAIRGQLITLALSFVKTLPAK
jgi:TfoX/Sxy family transcriptional regulator of competence genes